MSSELDEIQWKLPEWIQQFGLHTGNVLDYFSESPFYDRTSNNQVLRMQFQFQQVPPGMHPQKYLQLKLTEMVGIEFVVAYVREPDFWIVRKQRRIDPTTTVTEQDYYIIGANVYQAPLIHDILSSRLLSTVMSMRKLTALLNSMSAFSVSEGGHVYPEKTPANGTATTTPMYSSNPGTAQPANLGLATFNVKGTNEILATAFDKLLAGVTNPGGEKFTYLDEIPLYGKGSTVELLGLKVNLE